jgi:hypothetical protein
MTHQDIETNNQPDAADGKVGYKHPPIKSQFRKGQSGNRRGRPKGQRNLTPVLLEVLSQTVKVKQGGKTLLMSKGEALIQKILSQAHNGDVRAFKAALFLIEQIARIDTPELKLAGHGDYEFMFVPGVATSAEEWQWEIASRHEMAAIREAVAAARAAGISLTPSQRAFLRETVDAARVARTPLTNSQLDAIREVLGIARAANASRTVTRRPVNRRVMGSVNTQEQSNNETITPAQTPADQTALPAVPSVARTGTYRPVNRRPPLSPTRTPDGIDTASGPKPNTYGRGRE